MFGRSESSLFLMAHGQNRDGLRVNTIADHIATVAKVDHPVAELVIHVINGSPNARLLFQYSDALTYRRHRSFCGVQIFWCEEAIKPLDIQQCRRRPDQT